MRHISKKILLGVVVAAALIIVTNIAYAHERRMVGEYEFIVGFAVEPAIEGEKNGASLRVQIPAEEEGGEATPVEGVQETLAIEITHVPSGISKQAELRSLFGQPGLYITDLILTAPGQYQFHFTGTIGDLEVDEVFISGESFSDVHPSAEFQFPEPLPEAREMESAIRGALDSAQSSSDAIAAAESSAVAANEAAAAAEDAAASAQSTATIALVVGAIGLLAGAGGVVMGMRKK
jgi:hypothetical protein